MNLNIPQFNENNATIGTEFNMPDYNLSISDGLNIPQFNEANVGNPLTIDSYEPTFNVGNVGRSLTIDDIGNPNVGQVPIIGGQQPGLFSQATDFLGNAVGQATNFIGNNLGTIAGGLGGALSVNNAINRLQQVGDIGFRQGQGLASTLYDATQFRPYTVTTPTGAMFTAGPATGGAPTATTPSLPQGFDFKAALPTEAPPPTGGPSISVEEAFGVPYAGIKPAFPTKQAGTVNRMPVSIVGPSYPAGVPMSPTGGPIDPTTAFTGTDKGDALDPSIASTVAPMQYTSTLSPREQAFYEGAFGGAGSMFGSALEGTEARTRDIYGRMMDVLSPEMERQRLAQEERMAAQGRLGVSSNLYGGMAPEDFQLNRAQQEAMNNAYLGAMQQARGEQLQQANIGNMLLGASYIPQAQMLNAIQPGMAAAAQEQASRLTGSGMFGESYASGIDALLASAMGQSNLMGNLGSGLLSGTIQGATMGRTSGSDDLVKINQALNIIKQLS